VTLVGEKEEKANTIQPPFLCFSHLQSPSLTLCLFNKRSIHLKSGLISSFKFSSHMHTFTQTQKMDKLEQEVHELREEVTTLRAEMEKLRNLVSSMTVSQNQP